MLAGNQFGAKVVGNHLIGGKQAFLISAYPSETPNIWGWTHAPILGVTIQGNTIEDTQLGGVLDVEQSLYTKSDAGRVYFSGSFLNNSGVWSASYLSARSQSGVTSPPTLVTVGDALSADPGELVLTESGNTVSGPSSVVSGATFSVVSGTVNGVADRNVGLVLPDHSLSAGIRVAARPHFGRGDPGQRFALRAGIAIRDRDALSRDRVRALDGSLGATNSAAPGRPPGRGTIPHAPGSRAAGLRRYRSAWMPVFIGRPVVFCLRSDASSALVEDLLGDLPLADLAPLPAIGARPTRRDGSWRWRWSGTRSWPRRRRPCRAWRSGRSGAGSSRP